MPKFAWARLLTSVDYLSKFYEKIDFEYKAERFISLIKKLLSRNETSSKISSCYLASSIYFSLDIDQQSEIIELSNQNIQGDYQNERWDSDSSLEAFGPLTEEHS